VGFDNMALASTGELRFTGVIVGNDPLQGSLRSAADLTRARGISEGFARGKSGTALLAAIAEARAVPDADLPPAPREPQRAPASPALVALLKVLLAAKAEASEVAPKLIAASEDLERLAAETEPDIPALHGWRREVFGEDAQALKAGRLALGVAGRSVRLIRTER
jgi:ribonuclease D